MTPQKHDNRSIDTSSPAAISLLLDSNKPLSSTTPFNPSSLKEQVPTPFKKALFWPEEKKSDKKRTKERIPSAITSESWQEYHKRKEAEKKRKDEEKQKRAEERKRKKEEKAMEKKAMEIQKKTKRKRKVSESSSENDEEWKESGDSMDDVSIIDSGDERDEDESPNSSRTKNLKYDDIQVGDFVLAKFMGGKKSVFFYRYVCVVQKKYSCNDIEVMSLKSITEKSCFKMVETDVSTIRFADIVEKLPQPELQNSGDRIKYAFSRNIDIFEA